MSRPQDPQRPFLPFGNPFRAILPKGSYLSPKLLDLLNSFEETLAGKLKKLKPTEGEDILCLSWLKSSMQLLCEIHTDVKALITDLELPVNDWEDKWIDVYLDNSVKLLDISIAFSSQISRLKQGQLFLKFALHNLGSASANQLVQARSSMDEWRQHLASKNSRLDNCISIMDSLARMLDLPKIKNSAKGKVLMRAMYGVKATTLLVCSIFTASFSCSEKKLMDLQVPETYKWAGAFTDLQKLVNSEIGTKNSMKELDAVDAVVKKLYPIVQDGVDPVEAQVFKSLTSDLEKSAVKFSNGLDQLAKEVDSFFQILLSGRDALLGNLRVVVHKSEQK